MRPSKTCLSRIPGHYTKPVLQISFAMAVETNLCEREARVAIFIGGSDAKILGVPVRVKIMPRQITLFKFYPGQGFIHSTFQFVSDGVAPLATTASVNTDTFDDCHLLMFGTDDNSSRTVSHARSVTVIIASRPIEGSVKISRPNTTKIRDGGILSEYIIHKYSIIRQLSGGIDGRTVAWRC